MQTPYAVGMRLTVRGEQWLLTGLTQHGSTTLLTLTGSERENTAQRLRVLDPFDQPTIDSADRLRRRSRRAVLRAAMQAIGAERRVGGLWAAARAGITLMPYQLEPALAVIHGATRLLLADAVGLGKTIQAGLILAELRERGWIEHALIACPAGLRETWRRELHDRFALPVTILDHTSIAERVAMLPPGINPWSGHEIAIASIDLIKRPEVMRAIAEVPIDLLIADEAHHLAPGTDRGDAAQQLASRTPWVVLLSATPHSGDRAAFDFLTGLGSASDALTVVRRSRRDAGISASRRTHLLAVRATDAEIALLAGIDRYARDLWQSRAASDGVIRLLAIMLARRAASSMAAITRTLARRLELLGNPLAEPRQASLPWFDEDADDDRESDDMLAAPGLADAVAERDQLARLLDTAARCAAESKFARLARILSIIREPVVVFTEYRDTLEAVIRFLGKSRRLAAIHGGVNAELRRSAVDAFNLGAADILVATDAAGEGLNLHHRCRLVIDLELPWSPLRLEQRIGRVDRIGQQRTVHAIRMFHPDTIEQQVLDHLQLRGRRASAALDRLSKETDVAKAIFDGAPVEPDSWPLISSPSSGDAAGEAEVLTRQRRALAITGPQGNVFAAPRCGIAMTALTRHGATNQNGLVSGDHLAAHRICLSRAMPLGAPRKVAETVRDQLISSQRPQQPDAGVDMRAMRRRVAIIRDRIARERAGEYQGSLFDARADDAAAARHDALARLDQSLERLAQAIDTAIDHRASRVELVAMWPERRR